MSSVSTEGTLYTQDSPYPLSDPAKIECWDMRGDDNPLCDFDANTQEEEYPADHLA